MNITMEDVMKRLSDLESEVKSLKKAPAAKRFYNMADVCSILNRSRFTVHRMIKAGELRPVQKNGVNRFLCIEVDRYVSESAKVSSKSSRRGKPCRSTNEPDMKASFTAATCSTSDTGTRPGSQ